jgi:hypothetical protein
VQGDAARLQNEFEKSGNSAALVVRAAERIQGPFIGASMPPLRSHETIGC